MSSSIPSWQILTAHAQPFRGARDLAFCLKVPLDSLLIWASSEGSGETARMRRLAWTFAARIGYKYQIRLTRSTCDMTSSVALQQHYAVKYKSDVSNENEGNMDFLYLHKALSNFHEISHPLHRNIILIEDNIVHVRDDFLLNCERIFLREISN